MSLTLPFFALAQGMVGSSGLSRTAGFFPVELLFTHQFRFQLFNQRADQRLKFGLAASECRFVPNRLIAGAQIGQHQLKGVDPCVRIHPNGAVLQGRL